MLHFFSIQLPFLLQPLFLSPCVGMCLLHTHTDNFPLIKQEPKSKDRSWYSEPLLAHRIEECFSRNRWLCWSSEVPSQSPSQERGGSRLSPCLGGQSGGWGRCLVLGRCRGTLGNMNHGSHSVHSLGPQIFTETQGSRPLQIVGLLERSPAILPCKLLYNLPTSRNCCRTQVPESPVTPCGKR